jgi:hypothetical protein
MPIPVSCPSCGTGLKAPDSAAGRKVKCPKCATPFAVPAPGADFGAEVQAAPPRPVAAAPAPPARRAAPPPPDDEYDDAPPPRRRGGGDGNTGLQLGLGIAALSVGAVALPFAFIPCFGMFAWPLAAVGLIVGVVGLVIAFSRQSQGMAFPIAGTATSAVALAVSLYWWFAVTSAVNRAKSDMENAFGQLKNWKPPKVEFPGGPGPDAGNLPKGTPLALADGRATVNGELTDADPRDRLKITSPCKVYLVQMAAGKRYKIDLMSKVLDSYLRVENSTGQQLATNDDGGEGLNSRLIFAPIQAGEYRVIATDLIRPPLHPANGPFTLTIEELK